MNKSSLLSEAAKPVGPSFSAGIENGRVTELSVRYEDLGRTHTLTDMSQLLRDAAPDMAQTKKAEIDALVRAAFHGVPIILDSTVPPGKMHIHLSPELYADLKRATERHGSPSR